MRRTNLSSAGVKSAIGSPIRHAPKRIVVKGPWRQGPSCASSVTTQNTLHAAFTDPVVLGHVLELHASSPRLDDLAHDVFPEPVNDSPGQGRRRLGPNADLSILNWLSVIFAEPRPRASQQVSEVLLVGVGPRKVHSHFSTCPNQRVSDSRSCG